MTQGKIRAIDHGEKGGFDLSFLNGDITIPDQPDGYIVSCGCGVGKTSVIKQMIVMRYKEGILYCVDTKDELDKMETALLNMGIDNRDILKIHQDIDKDILSDYFSHPETLMQKPIILITHCRLFADLINFFVLYKPKSKVTAFDGDFKKLMQRNDTRRYIFLDETPLFFKPFATIPRIVLGCFAKWENEEWKCKERGEMELFYETFIKGTEFDFFKTEHALNNLKREVLFDLMEKNINRWMNLKDTTKDILVNFYSADFVQEGMKSHVIVFEGAGDILLRQSKVFKLLDIKQKYNSEVVFNKFQMDWKRKDDSVCASYIATSLESIIKGTTGKTLVVVWKDTGKEKEDEGSGTSAFRDEVRECLLNMYMNEEKFEITYYGASNTKSTNEFRDFENIVLCGKWDILNNKASQIDEAYLSSTSAQDQRLWYFVQLITRTAIRKHNGGKVKVWYSSDFSEKLINQLDRYFNQNTLYDITNDTNTWVKKLDEQRIRKNVRDDIIKLNLVNENVSLSILGNRPYELKMTLEDIYQLLPRAERKVKHYIPLRDNLSKLGITLTIE